MGSDRGVQSTDRMMKLCQSLRMEREEGDQSESQELLLSGGEQAPHCPVFCSFGALATSP